MTTIEQSQTRPGLGTVPLVHGVVSGLSAGVPVAFGRWATNLGTSIAIGALYGTAWWVLGALILMPAKLGMNVLVINEVALQSLMGHLMFGTVLGGVYAILARRSTH